MALPFSLVIAVLGITWGGTWQYSMVLMVLMSCVFLATLKACGLLGEIEEILMKWTMPMEKNRVEEVK